MSAFDVRPYEAGDEEGIVDLFNRVFSEGNPGFERRTVADWSAIYVDNPAGLQTFVATDDDGRIIGNYSSIPAHCHAKGRRLMSTQAVDTCVEKAYRGRLSKRSVFVTLATEFIGYYSTPGRQPFDQYMWGLPNEQAFPVGTRIIGYKPVHCPLPVHEVTVSGAWREQLAARAGSYDLADEGAGSADPLAELEALFLRHLDPDGLGLWKDAEYLAWRYRPRQGTGYRSILARRNGELVGAVVYRLGWMGQHVVPLVDWFGPGDDEGLLAALLGGVGDVVLEAGGEGFPLQTWATPAMAHLGTLSRLGFESQDSPFNLCIMTFGDGLDPEWAGRRWAVTMGDSDIY